MKKILLLLDAQNCKGEILDFAAAIAKPDNATIVGVFCEQKHLAAMPSVKALGGQVYVEEIVENPAEQNNRNKLAETNIELFKNGCITREMEGLVHREVGDPLDTIVGETRYADLLILDPSISFDGDKRVPSKFVMDVLSRAECPVLIAPEYFEQLDEIVFAYDGTRSSAYAIRQFHYQLPHLAHKKITILHVTDGDKPSERYLKEKHLFTEWTNMNFEDVSFIELRGNPREILFEYFMDQNSRYNKMFVTGAFGRNLLSTFFRPSTADLVLKAIDIPIFVSHITR